MIRLHDGERHVWSVACVYVDVVNVMHVQVHECVIGIVDVAATKVSLPVSPCCYASYLIHSVHLG